MRDSFHHIDRFRIINGEWGSDPTMGGTGAFRIPGPCGMRLRVISSDAAQYKEAGLPGMPWEHVSVSTKHRAPWWQEMSYVKDLFWGPEEAVVEFHPPRSEYVSHHPHTLHLWRPIGLEIPRPPTIMIGPSVTGPDFVTKGPVVAHHANQSGITGQPL